MTLKTFISKLNWRLILVHLLACSFFIFAFRTVFFAFFPNIVEAARQPNDAARTKFLQENLVQNNTLFHFYFWTAVSGFIGLLVAVSTSFVIAKRHKWFWCNSLIVFIVSYLLTRYQLFEWEKIKQFFWYPGQQLTHSIPLEFIINGAILLAIGLFIFLSAFSNRFIEKKFSVVNH